MGYSELIRVPIFPNSAPLFVIGSTLIGCRRLIAVIKDWIAFAVLNFLLNNLCTVPVDLSSSVSCVKLYAQQHFTSCFTVYFLLTPVLVITESISASIFCSLPSSPESRIHHNFSRQISDDNI
ncbi:hypothetical protein T02_1219 [Trichinella nativa]|uniref:Uncharacterized protein n=1 Tax=Trichinella nativa TaxID=6335 RepID=A0A0V1KQ90_9BILA|nr:hypothetical protein T02_1219 [Trichinella nativa]